MTGSRQGRTGSNPGSRRVTSTDVARASGVSRATVSYVLNDAPNQSISSATRDLVLETAARLGHVPYAPARALRSGNTRVVLAVVSGFSIGHVLDTALDRLSSSLTTRGFALVVARINEASETMKIQELWGLVTPAAVISFGGILRRDNPIFLNTNVGFIDELDFVPHSEIMQTQAEYIVRSGHTRIGYAYPADPSLEEYAKLRLAGVEYVCAEHGLPDPLVRRIGADENDVKRAITDWLSGDEPVTAVCAHNDVIALTIMAALTSLGLTPGDDLAVIGADNIPIAGIGLTTVAMDVDAFSETLETMVFDALDGQPLRGTMLAPGSIVKRRSA